MEGGLSPSHDQGHGEVLQGTLDLMVLKTLEAIALCTDTELRSASSKFPKIF